jgi:methyl-accepting chemotaxis protein
VKRPNRCSTRDLDRAAKLTVDPARAGEAGAGFAVVADEVRALAQRSAQAAKETAEKIDDSIAKSNYGVEISGKVAEGLLLITQKTRQVNTLVVEIASASKEQNQGISQVSTAVSQMDKVTQSNASNAEETAAAAEELNAQSATLLESVGDLLRLVGGTGQASATRAVSRGSRLADKSNAVRSASLKSNLISPRPAAPARAQDARELAHAGGRQGRDDEFFKNS